MRTLILLSTLLFAGQSYAVGAFDDDNLVVLSKCQDKAVAALSAFASVEPQALPILRYSLSKKTWPWFSLKDTDTVTVGEGEQVTAETFVFSDGEIREISMKFIQEGCQLNQITFTIGE